MGLCPSRPAHPPYVCAWRCFSVFCFCFCLCGCPPSTPRGAHSALVLRSIAAGLPHALSAVSWRKGMQSCSLRHIAKLSCWAGISLVCNFAHIAIAWCSLFLCTRVCASLKVSFFLCVCEVGQQRYLLPHSLYLLLSLKKASSSALSLCQTASLLYPAVSPHRRLQWLGMYRNC